VSTIVTRNRSRELESWMMCSVFRMGQYFEIGVNELQVGDLLIAACHEEMVAKPIFEAMEAGYIGQLMPVLEVQR
jgi:hypothetical protein